MAKIGSAVNLHPQGPSLPHVSISLPAPSEQCLRCTHPAAHAWACPTGPGAPGSSRFRLHLFLMGLPLSGLWASQVRRSGGALAGSPHQQVAVSPSRCPCVHRCWLKRWGWLSPRPFLPHLLWLHPKPTPRLGAPAGVGRWPEVSPWVGVEPRRQALWKQSRFFILN